MTSESVAYLKHHFLYSHFIHLFVLLVYFIIPFLISCFPPVLQSLTTHTDPRQVQYTACWFWTRIWDKGFPDCMINNHDTHVIKFQLVTWQHVAGRRDEDSRQSKHCTSWTRLRPQAYYYIPIDFLLSTNTLFLVYFSNVSYQYHIKKEKKKLRWCNDTEIKEILELVWRAWPKDLARKA